MNNYHDTIIEESLGNKSVLKGIQTLNTKVENAMDFRVTHIYIYDVVISEN